MLTCLVCAPFHVAAQQQDGTRATAATLDRIVVRSSRLEGVRAFDIPASISVVDLGASGQSPSTGISDALEGVPGVLSRERQNYAQDTQLSIRGIGARSTFGVRGLRLYADGIPATMPDGQGQLSHMNLLAADRIEVMRGPFSALYGNSSGGVVQVWSADGDASTETRLQGSLGSNNTRTLGGRVRGEVCGMGYHVAASLFETDGYREHSAAKRESVNLKLNFKVGARGKLDLVANHFNSPDAQDPLGLTRTQSRQDPRQATSVALQYNTRKSARQDQLGIIYEQAFGEGNTLRMLAYGGKRSIEQFLPLPISAQNNPLNSGGVIDLDSDYGGADLRWSWRGELAARPFELSVGLNADRQRQQRHGFENYVGSTLGVRGRLRRDELSEVSNFDQYAQAWWEFAPRWSLLAGVRHSEVRFESRDDYVTATNPDDSGRVDYAETTPVIGLTFAPRDSLRLYVSAGRGFETPTFNELGYRSDGGAGLAFDLLPATSLNTELGAKWRSVGGATLEAAVFRADTDDELAVARNVGGRSSYRNVGRARRQGLELAAGLPLGQSWRADIAYTRLDASFRDRFPICTASGCTTPTTVVQAGTRIPGVARDQLSARLQWRNDAWTLAAQAVGVGEVTVNDLGSETAPGYLLLDLEAGRDWRMGNGTLHGFVRIDNALDQRYLGSVIVNEGNARYYEPGPDRTFVVGARWQWGD
ncbi:MAG: TonB-dependent receptor [Pseudoxanthomonas sp.]